jgi:hypothetical protein
VAIQKGHALVTGGIYRRIRNPSYLGLLISVIGRALAFRSVAGLVLAIDSVCLLRRGPRCVHHFAGTLFRWPVCPSRLRTVYWVGDLP